jgi:putative FmdB family regulatory protein
MPVYDIRCETCGKEGEIYRSLAEFDDLPECCGQKVRRVINAPRIIQDIQPYRSMATGEMITTRDQHRNHLKQHNLIEIGNEKIKPKTKSWAEEKAESDDRKRDLAAAFDTVAEQRRKKS